MAGTKLCKAQWQLPITSQTLVIYLHMTRTVHRLNSKIFVFTGDRKHIVTKLICMARLLPQRHIDNLWCVYFFITLLYLTLAHVLLHRLID